VVPNVNDHFTHKLGFTVRNLRWVRHFLFEADKYSRAQLSFELFEMLQHQKDRVWHDTAILDKSWFCFTTGHEGIWLPEETEAPERERITFQSGKIMVTIA
jgi:hypothetical protein